MRLASLILGLLILLSASLTFAQEETTIRVVTYSSFSVSEDVLADFTEETGINVEIVRLNDAGTLVNQAILTKDNPLGDVLYGIDNTFLTRGLEGEIFQQYESPLLENIPDDFKLDPEFYVSPVTYGDICLNYDVSYFEENELEIPDELSDLTAPEYESLLAVQNPATSSPGLGFLLTTINAFDTEGDYTYLDYWTELVENDVLILDGWSEVYYGAFTVAGGDRPLVVSYASSPPAEVLFASEPVEEAPTGAIVADDMCFRQIEFVGILDGTEETEAAQTFVDFVLSEPFQQDLPLQMFVYPVVEDIELPEIFAEYTVIPDEPVVFDTERLEENREAWLREWTESILR